MRKSLCRKTQSENKQFIKKILNIRLDGHLKLRLQSLKPEFRYLPEELESS